MGLNRREFLCKCSAAAVGAAALCGHGSLLGNVLLSNKSIQVNAGQRRPNIVILLADDLGYGDLGCFGSAMIQTPNLDELATEGVRFTSSYAGAPNCSPSRAGLLTGRNPNRAGIYNYVPPSSPMHLPASEITISKLLKQSGYDTCHVGKWHLNSSLDPASGFPQPSDHGFDHSYGTQNNSEPTHYNPTNFWRNGVAVNPSETLGYSCHLIVDEAIEWLEDTHDQSKPFFLYVAFNEPHRLLPSENELPADIMALYPDESGIGWPESGSRYYATVTNMDRAAGTLLKKLDELHLRENTLVVFLSDNGPWREGSQGPLRAKKGYVYEGGIRTPGIIRWPGHTTPGGEFDVPIEFVDFLPTICEVAGIPKPSDRTLDGTSLLPALQNKRLYRETPLFWFHYGRSPQAAIHQGDWVMVGHLSQLPISGSFCQDQMNFVKRQPPYEGLHFSSFELYNITNDISQSQDLSSSQPKRFNAMKTKLQIMYESVTNEGPTWTGLPAC